MLMADHKHILLWCPDCDAEGCRYCDFRGYYEQCAICGEPMGNARRKWKRERERRTES